MVVTVDPAVKKVIYALVPSSKENTPASAPGTPTGPGCSSAALVRQGGGRRLALVQQVQRPWRELSLAYEVLPGTSDSPPHGRATLWCLLGCLLPSETADCCVGAVGGPSPSEPALAPPPHRRCGDIRAALLVGWGGSCACTGARAIGGSCRGQWLAPGRWRAQWQGSQGH